jgi:hypothetical protein
MKKTRNLLLLATLFVSIFAFAVTANARAWGFSRAQLVCNPEELEAGGSADCYYFGKPSGEVSESNAGFYTRMYSTDNLVIDDVVVNAKLSGAGARYVESASLNEAVIQTPSADMPSKLSGFRCVVEPAGGDAKSTGCGIFYSTQSSGSDNKVYKAASMVIYGDLTAQKVKTKINTTDVAVLGHIKVSLPDTNDVEACGNLCIASYAIGSNDDWDRGDCTNNAGTSEWSGESCEGSTPSLTPATQGKQEEFDCFEIKLKQGTPQHVPESGAFVSYAILAAGALIAISAVTIAKKHNRIQKI